MPVSITRKSIGSHLHPKSNTRIHLLPKMSRIHYNVKSASNVQHYNPTPLFLSWNNYQLIVQGCTPNVHLIPYGNANDQNKSIYDLPFSATQSLRNLVTPSEQSLTFQVPLVPPSWAIHPLARFPSIGRYKNQGIYLTQHIIPIIACSWKSIDTIRYQCPTMALFLLLLVSIPLLLLLILAIGFKHPTGHVHFSYTKNITSIRFKIN